MRFCRQKKCFTPYLAQKKVLKNAVTFSSLLWYFCSNRMLVMIHGSWSGLKAYLVLTRQHLCFKRENRSLMFFFLIYQFLCYWFWIFCSLDTDNLLLIVWTCFGLSNGLRQADLLQTINWNPTTGINI